MKAILAISSSSFSTARRLREALPDAQLFTTVVDTSDMTVVSSLSDFIAEAFPRYEAFLFVGAMGICVRTIAPHITDKHTDPAVICIDSMGRKAISVLSGHIGGANQLTLQIARLLGAEPVITTYSDLAGLWALDTLDARFSWHLVAPSSINPHISYFTSGQPTALVLQVRDTGTDWMEAHLPSHVTLFRQLEEVDFSRYKLLITVSPLLPDLSHLPADVLSLCYQPRSLCLGLGLARQAAPVEQVVNEVKACLQQNGIAWESISRIATIDIKQDEPALQALATEGLPLSLFSADALSAVDVPTPSEVVQGHVGTPSVSEAAAILGTTDSLAEGTLILPKQKGSNYTVAVAIPTHLLRRGHIEIVGAGPGDPDLISVRGRQFLERADLILYAGSLVPVELTHCAKPGCRVESSASLDLEQQFALMKEYYDRGLLVVRLHTGDPCIYGAIQEQMNYFDQYGMEYHITPGISSFQAAAAALRSQFTIPERVQSIILTRGEGRTPMPEKEKLHLLARSQSTMCIFLSAGIADKVEAELLQAYPPTTPVAVCHHLTWKDERIYRGELKDLARIVKENHLTLTTMIVVGDAIDNRQGLSRLYAHEFKHLFRP